MSDDSGVSRTLSCTLHVTMYTGCLQSPSTETISPTESQDQSSTTSRSVAELGTIGLCQDGNGDVMELEPCLLQPALRAVLKLFDKKMRKPWLGPLFGCQSAAYPPESFPSPRDLMPANQVRCAKEDSTPHSNSCISVSSATQNKPVAVLCQWNTAGHFWSGVTLGRR